MGVLHQKGSKAASDDPGAGWKGRALWADLGQPHAASNIEGIDAPSAPAPPGKTPGDIVEVPLVVQFQLRPDPLATLAPEAAAAVSDLGKLTRPSSSRF